MSKINLKINFISYFNDYGYHRDTEIIKELVSKNLNENFHFIYGFINDSMYKAPLVDINIHVGIPTYNLFKYAKMNILFVNISNYYKYYLKNLY